MPEKACPDRNLPSPKLSAFRDVLNLNLIFHDNERQAKMVVIGNVANDIVAVGTITTGIAWLGGLIFRRGRKAEKERAERAKVAAELEELRKRLSDQ